MTINLYDEQILKEDGLELYCPIKVYNKLFNVLLMYQNTFWFSDDDLEEKFDDHWRNLDTELNPVEIVEKVLKETFLYETNYDIDQGLITDADMWTYCKPYIISSTEIDQILDNVFNK